MIQPASPGRPADGPARAGEGGRPGSAAGTVYLHAGQLKASVDPLEITTVLGSCVAVTLHDARFGIGGMNHFMLPLWSGRDTASPRFGDVAVARLIESLLGLGADRAALRARIFGGACVISAFQGTGRHLGISNAEQARELLREARVPVIEERTGGTRGMRLKFRTDTGECRVNELAGG